MLSNYKVFLKINWFLRQSLLSFRTLLLSFYVSCQFCKTKRIRDTFATEMHTTMIPTCTSGRPVSIDKRVCLFVCFCFFDLLNCLFVCLFCFHQVNDQHIIKQSNTHTSAVTSSLNLKFQDLGIIVLIKAYWIIFCLYMKLSWLRL